MIWSIIFLSLGILVLGLLISSLYFWIYHDDINKAMVGSCIMFIAYLIILTLVAIPLGAWKTLELLGY